MTVAVGEKIHVIERRQFQDDVRRHFLGEVMAVADATIRVTGYSFVYDMGTTSYVRSPGLRTRILPLGSAGVIINVVSPEADIEAARYDYRDGRVVITDGGAFTHDINEFGSTR